MEEISDLSGLKASYVFTILKEKFKLHKICARWIPHLLTPEQKKDRVEKASVLLSRFKNLHARRLRDVVTGDELGPFFEPDNKLNNKMWVGENNDHPVVARRRRSVRRVMYALFFDRDGIVARVSVPENCSLTGTFYRDLVLSAIFNHYQAKRRGPGSEGSYYSMIAHPLTVLQWWSLTWRNFIFRSCHTHPTAGGTKNPNPAKSTVFTQIHLLFAQIHLYLVI